MRQRLVFVHTTADYRGDAVTVLGVPSARLLAVAGYNTPRQHVLGLITVREPVLRLSSFPKPKDFSRRVV